MPHYQHDYYMKPNSTRWMSLEDFPNEIWKPIKSYEQSYMVSSYGRIKSIDRIIYFSDGRIRKFKGCILRTHRINQHYYVVSLSENQRRIMKDVHRLVAEAFIPNPDNLPEVNHKDENSLNNNVDNLEWCTRRYNLNYGAHNRRGAEHRRNNPKYSKPVVQKSVNGSIIQIFPSIREAARSLGNVKKDANILKVCKGINQTSFGYKWEYYK